MSNLFRWREWRAMIARILPYAAIVAAAPLLCAPILLPNDARADDLAEALGYFGSTIGITGVILLAARWQIRQGRQNADDIMLMAASAVADSMRRHLDPDSPWRLNVIKEVGDHINDDNAITLAAIEGTVWDLGQRIAAMRKELDQLQRGN